MIERTVAEPAPPALRPGRKRDHSRDPEILAAALDVLAETGYEGMTLDLVAARAKAGKATLYRRWSGKAELVVDAVACLKSGEDQLPDTGRLRGDLIASIRSHSLAEGERKLRIMAGLMSMLSRNPELAEVTNAMIVEPRAAAMRILMGRAVDRGEISADCDLETISLVGPSMAAYRLLILQQPVDCAFMVSLVDAVILPSLGLPPGRGTSPSGDDTQTGAQ
ncbi:TetR/AcrR family transcriptional regulator [uncultured Friedmanniella sp.]|uniref:TetR/AcrR family transcriptional regulator n=1 Tax=uncultured Friedmanniella sp. TaxID=335381 RepID=UPI0035CC2406